MRRSGGLPRGTSSYDTDTLAPAIAMEPLQPLARAASTVKVNGWPAGAELSRSRGTSYPTITTGMDSQSVGLGRIVSQPSTSITVGAAEVKLHSVRTFLPRLTPW